MKTIRNICAAVMAVLLTAALFAGCSEKGGAAVEKVELNKSELTVYIGESETLAASLSPEGADAEIAWTSDNTNVATVGQDGTVKGVAVGTAKITAAAGGKSADCTVNVLSDAEVKHEGFLYYEDFNDRLRAPSYLNPETAGDGAIGVADGALTFAVTEGGSATALYEFENALSGTVVIEARVKAESKNFLNALFLCSAEGEKIACLGMDACGFRSNDGTGWSATIARYETGVWYDIRMLVDTDAETYGLYIGNDGYTDLPFCGSGEIAALSIGCDKPDTAIAYDSVKVYDAASRQFPVIDAEKLAYTASLDKNNTVTLDYEVSGAPAPSVTLTADRTEGVTIGADNKTVTFSSGAAAGVYTLTLRAENEVSATEKQFTVAVRAQDNVIFDEDFDTTEVPYGMTLNASYGSASVENGSLHLTTDEAGRSTKTSAVYDFIDPLSGTVTVETRVKNSSTGTSHFANLIFLYDASATNADDSVLCTVSVAIEKNNLKYHDGGGWKTIQTVENGAWLEMKITLNFSTRKMSIELNGETVLSNKSFRSSSYANSTSKMIVGSTKSGCDGEYDYLRFLRAE